MGKDTNYFGQPVFAQAVKFVKKSDVNGIISKFKSDRYTKRRFILICSKNCDPFCRTAASATSGRICLKSLIPQ